MKKRYWFLIGFVCLGVIGAFTSPPATKKPVAAVPSPVPESFDYQVLSKTAVGVQDGKSQQFIVYVPKLVSVDEAVRAARFVAEKEGKGLNFIRVWVNQSANVDADRVVVINHCFVKSDSCKEDWEIQARQSLNEGFLMPWKT